MAGADGEVAEGALAHFVHAGRAEPRAVFPGADCHAQGIDGARTDRVRKHHPDFRGLDPADDAAHLIMGGFDKDPVADIDPVNTKHGGAVVIDVDNFGGVFAPRGGDMDGKLGWVTMASEEMSHGASYLVTRAR